MADPFYDARNALTMGNFHQALAEASGVKPPSRKADEVSAFNIEKDALLALAQVGLGQTDAVLSQLAAATSPALGAVRGWALLVAATARSAQTDAALAELDAAWGARPVCLLAARLFSAARLMEGDTAAALRSAKESLSALSPPQGAAAVRAHVELRALCVEALLRRGRIDLARAEVRAMEQLDDEAILTVLYSGVVSLHEGVKARDAYHTALQRFKELAMRCGPSVLAHNLTAMAHMELGDFAAAERSLLDALAMKSGDADTTANLAVVSAHLGKAADATNRYIQQGNAIPGTWSAHFAAMHNRLDEAIEEFKADQ